MATEENLPSLYSALSSAMTDPELISDLLRHPEFLRKARIICNRIAGPSGSDDLLQEACARVAERVSQINPNSIRNEAEFFGWFSLLARRVHLSRKWSVVAVSSCTEEAAGWPDALADVLPEELDQFLGHVDACPYHTRLLQAEDKKLRAIFRRARGLDSKGRILCGAELQASITEHKRRFQKWSEAALQKGGLFGGVALSNGGRDIASCGRFYDFSIHISRNELDPAAGLQIRGVTSSDPDEDVLLGFYPLAGVGHEDQEQPLKLDNGYTVGLKVKQVTETTFDIHFRCVETSTLEAECAVEDRSDAVLIETIDDERLDSLPGDLVPPVPVPEIVMPPPSAGSWPLPQGWQAGAMISLMMLFVAVGCFRLGEKYGQPAAGHESMTQKTDSQSTPPSRVRPLTGSDKELNPDKVSVTGDRASNAGPFAGQSGRRGQRGVKPPEVRLRNEDPLSASVIIPNFDERRTPVALQAVTRQDDERGMLLRPKVLASAEEIRSVAARVSEGNPPIPSVPGVVPGQTSNLPLSSTNEVNDQRSTRAELLSYMDPRPLASKSEGMGSSTSFRNVSHGNRGDLYGISVLHRAPNDAVAKRIHYALSREKVTVESMAKQVAKLKQGATFRVEWSVVESSWGETSPLVKLNAHVFRKDEKNSVFHDSYEVMGVSLDDAYDEAVEVLVKAVIDWIRGDTEKSHSVSAKSRDMEQLRADEPKVKLIGEDKDRDVIHANRKRPQTLHSRLRVNVDNGPGCEAETEENNGGSEQ